MVLGKLPVPGRPTIWIIVGQGPTVLAVGAGGGYLDIFTLIHPFSPLPSSLWETARYRLKYCLKGPLSPKQPTSLIKVPKQPQILKHLTHIHTHAHTYFDKRTRKMCTLNRMNSSFANMLSFKYPNLNSSNIYFYIFSYFNQKTEVNRKHNGQPIFR